MKFFKWKIFIATSAVCLLSILFGVSVWDKLPESVAIHFDINGNPDGFASKAFAVFGLPIMTVVLQLICCIINDVNAKKHGERVKFERVTKWIIPVMTVVLQVVTIGYALGWKLDIRRIVVFIVGTIFIVIGNYLPKFDYIKNHDVSTDKARKINRFIGYESVIMGVIMMASLFFPPTASVVGLILLIPYAVIATVYGVVVGKSK